MADTPPSPVPTVTPPIAPAPSPAPPQAIVNPTPVSVVSTPVKHPILVALDIAGTVAVIIIAANIVKGWLGPKHKHASEESS